MQTAEKFDYYNSESVNDKKEEKQGIKKGDAKEKVRRFRYQKRLMFRALFMAAIVMVVGIGFTAYGTSIKYQINETNLAIEKLQTEIDDLNLQVTANTAPEVIEQKAISELGMEYPTASQYVYINSGTGGVYTADANN